MGRPGAKRRAFLVDLIFPVDIIVGRFARQCRAPEFARLYGEPDTEVISFDTSHSTFMFFIDN